MLPERHRMSLASPAVQTENLDANGKTPNDLAAPVVPTAALDASGKPPNDLATLQYKPKL